MAIGMISRLKKSKQVVTVVDLQGNKHVGRVSHWDESVFAIITENGDDVFFPLNGFSSITLPGGLEKREPLEFEKTEE